MSVIPAEPERAVPPAETVGPYKLTLGTKLFYGVGSIASGTVSQGLSAFVMLFFNQVMGLPAQWVGFAIMIALIADAFWDPMVGQWSDRTRTGWGRRHPFMYAAAIPAAVAFYFMWNPPQGLSHELLFAYLLACLIGVRFLISFYDIPSAALAPELAPKYDDRAGLFAFRYLFAIAGGLALVTYTYSRLISQEAGTFLDAAGFATYGLIGAVIIVGSILVASLGTHSQIKHLHRPPVSNATLGQMMREVFETMWNKSLIVITISGLISGIAAGLTSGLSAYFGLYYWAISPAQLPILIAAGTVASVLGLSIAPALARKFDKKPAVMILLWASLFFGTAPMIGRMLGLMPANGTPELLAILTVQSFISGAIGVCAVIILTSMIADIVEDSQAKTGRRSEGLLLSADSILQKVISGAGVFMSGLLLAAVNFPQNASPETIDQGVLNNLALVYVPVTTILSAAAIACIYFFPINRQRHEENLARIRDGGTN